MKTVSLTRMYRQKFGQLERAVRSQLGCTEGSPQTKDRHGAVNPWTVGMQASMTECLGGFLALKGLSLACLVVWRFRRPSEWVG